MVIDGRPIPSFTHTQQLLQLLATMGWEGKEKEGLLKGKNPTKLKSFPKLPFLLSSAFKPRQFVRVCTFCRLFRELKTKVKLAETTTTFQALMQPYPEKNPFCKDSPPLRCNW